MKVLKTANNKVLFNNTDTKVYGGNIIKSQTESWHQCPIAVRDFLDYVTQNPYNPNDYSYTKITDYAPSVAIINNTKPIGKTLGDRTFYNNMPNDAVEFFQNDVAGTITAQDSIRWINSQTPNMRDIGGWACDGGNIRYGLIYRSGQLNAQDRELIINEFNIKSELDLRGEDGIPTFDNSLKYTKSPTSIWYSLQPINSWRINIKAIFDSVRLEEPIICHCMEGADRTGTLICIIEGLLGVSQSDIDTDYELTSFSTGTDTSNNLKARTNDSWKGLITQIKNIPLPNGVEDTFSNHVIYFVASLGFTEDNINEFRGKMIVGNPQLITLSLDNYSVTKTGTNVEFINELNVNNGQIKSNMPYSVSIKPEPGYTISNIQVLMNGLDVTDSVFTGYMENYGNINISTNGTHNVAGYNNATVSTDGYNGIITFSSPSRSLELNTEGENATHFYMTKINFDYTSSQIVFIAINKMIDNNETVYETIFGRYSNSSGLITTIRATSKDESPYFSETGKIIDGVVTAKFSQASGYVFNGDFIWTTW